MQSPYHPSTGHAARTSLQAGEQQAATNGANSPPRMLKMGEVAARLCISRRSLYRRIQQGDVPDGVKLGECRRWPEPLIDKLLADWTHASLAKMRSR
jgi:predicted DNA-binding transcriptional regulator AlpA